MYDHTLFLCLQIIRTNLGLSEKLVIADGPFNLLEGFVCINIFTLSRPRWLVIGGKEEGKWVGGEVQFDTKCNEEVNVSRDSSYNWISCAFREKEDGKDAVKRCLGRYRREMCHG